jgi:hypothetical protein
MVDISDVTDNEVVMVEEVSPPPPLPEYSPNATPPLLPILKIITLLPH